MLCDAGADEFRNAGMIFRLVKIAIKIEAFDVVGRVEVDESFGRPLLHAGLQELQGVLPSESDSISQSGNGLNAINEFRGVETRVNLPWPGLVPTADDAAVENSAAVRPVEKKRRKAQSYDVMLFRTLDNLPFAYPIP